MRAGELGVCVVDKVLRPSLAQAGGRGFLPSAD